MGESKIEWANRTWNPIRGCTRISRGCEHCYAERFAARGLLGMRSPTTGEAFATMTPNGPRWTGKVELIPSKLAEPLRWRRPARVFVNSMSDLFHEALAVEDIAAVFGVMAACPQHTFQVLTKRPERAAEFFAWLTLDRLQEEGENLAGRMGWCHAGEEDWRLPLRNVHLGVSVEDQATADARIPILLRCPAAVRFVSYEPGLGPVDFGRSVKTGNDTTAEPLTGVYQVEHPPCARDTHAGGIESADGGPRIDWLICGGESGPGARPFEVGWARSAVKQCRTAGVPIFVKQFGARPVARVREDMTEDRFVAYDANGWNEHDGPIVLRLRDRKGGDMSEWPEDLRIREFPEVAHA